MGVAQTPEPPYYAVIFSSIRADWDGSYDKMAEKMVQLAKEEPGFLGVESARDANGFGITVSYWNSEESIRKWKANAEHRLAQKYGREKWYARYFTRVARVERDYDFIKKEGKSNEVI